MAAPRPGRSSETRRSRRGRCPSESASARAEALRDKEIHSFHLSKNYRNSAEIYDYAAAYADRVGLDADLPEAVRSTGVAPEERVVTDLEQGVRDALGLGQPASSRARSGSWRRSPARPRCAPGSGRGRSTRQDRAGGSDARVAVLTGLDTKGLEFDAIVVVEPAEIEAESPTGRATLYVVLTRATQRMVTVRRG